MRNTLSLGAGLLLGLMGAVLFLRAGLPPAIIAILFWMTGGAVGISLLQFAFFKESVQATALAAKARPLRAFLLGLLVLEVPFLVWSCCRLAGSTKLAGLVLIFCFGVLLLALWPANISYLVGQKLAPELKPHQQVTGGSLVVASSLLVPVFGWLWLCYLAALTTGGFCLRGQPNA